MAASQTAVKSKNKSKKKSSSAKSAALLARKPAGKGGKVSKAASKSASKSAVAAASKKVAKPVVKNDKPGKLGKEVSKLAAKPIATTVAKAKEIVRSAAKAVAPSDTDAFVEQVIQRLRERGETVGFAESCTGGLLSSMLAAVPGASDVFIGSVIAYDNEVKKGLLGVTEPLLRSIGAVSLPVARHMAIGVREAIGSTWGVSITGIAGPGGGTPQKPVGTVCFAVSGPGVEVVEQEQLDGNRRAIQANSARRALELLAVELGPVEAVAKAKKGY